MKCTCFSSLSKLLVVQWWRSSKIIILLSSFGTWNHQISSTLPLPKTSCENHDCIPMLPLQLDRKIVYIPWFGRKLNRFLSILINWDLKTNYPNFEFSIRVTFFVIELDYESSFYLSGCSIWRNSCNRVALLPLIHGAGFFLLTTPRSA